MESKLMTFQEAVEYSKIPKTVLGRLVRTGEIPLYRITNKTILFDPKDLDEFLESKKLLYKKRGGK